jgi:uncharacterized protein YjlB
MTSDSDGVRADSENPLVITYFLEADAEVPNNTRLPLLVYPAAVELSPHDPASVFEQRFVLNGWVGCWRNGIFPFHHFHSTAHEVLGIYSGSAVARLGGENGVTVTLNPGDVVIIPAGVAHKKLSSSGGFGVVGAYPSGQQPDMCRANASACQRAAEQVARVLVPECDPVHGDRGPMCAHWRQ